MAGAHVTPEDGLTGIIVAVKQNKKYQQLDESFIAAIASKELHHCGNDVSAALKATKAKLHQVCMAYWRGDEKQVNQLVVDFIKNPVVSLVDWKTQMLLLMRSHVSTYERSGYIDEFYRSIFAILPSVSSVLDMACGFNPLAIPWMDLKPDASYRACDVDHRVVGTLNQFAKAIEGSLRVKLSAEICDATRTIPAERVDLAFLLKAIPCLEQIDKLAGQKILSNLHADHIVVTFPSRSLGGKSKGMHSFYASHLQEILPEEIKISHQIDFPQETVYLLQRA